MFIGFMSQEGVKSDTLLCSTWPSREAEEPWQRIPVLWIPIAIQSFKSVRGGSVSLSEAQDQQPGVQDSPFPTDERLECCD